MGKKRIVSILGDAAHDHDLLLNALNAITGNKSYEFDITDIKAEDLNNALSGNPEVVVLSKMNTYTAADGTTGMWLTGDIEDKLINYVEAGGGLLVWHSGLYGHAVDSKFTQMLGGRFTHRPPNLLAVKYSTIGDTPMTGDAIDIEISDEHFLIECDMEKANVFMNASSSGGETPAGWYRKVKKGKVCCVSTPHPSNEIKSLELNEIIFNCLKWCSEKE